MEKNKIRNSNLEMLRIISMFLIIAHHYSVHGFKLLETRIISFNEYFIDILSLGGKIGVSCFILLSGYFMINNKFTIKKLWKILGEVLFYSLGSFILFLTILKPVNGITMQEIEVSIFPISYSAYWFVTYYVLLMIISPFINKFIKSLTKNELRNFIILMTFIWSIYRTIINADLGFSEFGWFIILYCISAYIKLYVSFDSKKLKINKIILFISSLLLVISIILVSTMNIIIESPNTLYYIKEAGRVDNILIVVISISMFIYFCNKEARYNRFINEIAKYVLGVYLIHDNILFRPYLWQEILKNTNYYESNYLIIHAIISVMVIYVVCTIIDWLRSKLLEPVWLKIYQQYDSKVNDFIQKIN